MKKILIFAGLAVLLVGLPLLSKFTGGSDAKQVEIQKVEFKLIKSSILASGTLAFREQVQLRSEVIGQVTELHVEETDQVKKGDMVITLDPKTYQAQVEQAEARVRIQRIAIERQHLLIKTISDRFARQQVMFAKNLVDENSYEAVESELALSKVDLRSLQESLAQASAALDQSEELLSKTRIRSPIDGVVIQVDIKVGEILTEPLLIIVKSTVPVGTCDRVRKEIQKQLDARGEDITFNVASNPEFLAEGTAIKHFMQPDRIVCGVEDEHSEKLLREMYAPFNRNHEKMIFMDVRSSELTKYSANAMLATRISLMNELANIAERAGADIELVRKGIGSDPRIGYSFIYAGPGYGGSCFPKDVRALAHTANSERCAGTGPYRQGARV